MSSETMREAARQIRADQGYATDHAAWFAVADWLDACATVLEVNRNAVKAHALTVARAYLGVDS